MFWLANNKTAANNPCRAPPIVGAFNGGRSLPDAPGRPSFHLWRLGRPAGQAGADRSNRYVQTRAAHRRCVSLAVRGRRRIGADFPRLSVMAPGRGRPPGQLGGRPTGSASIVPAAARKLVTRRHAAVTGRVSLLQHPLTLHVSVHSSCLKVNSSSPSTSGNSQATVNNYQSTDRTQSEPMHAPQPADLNNSWAIHT